MTLWVYRREINDSTQENPQCFITDAIFPLFCGNTAWGVLGQVVAGALIAEVLPAAGEAE